MSCGIYKIKNNINNKIYIGQSKNIEQRWKHHLWESFNDKQVMYNYSIHKAFRKYGIDNFSFDIIEEVPEDKLFEREKYWIEFYNSYKEGYNETEGGDSGPALKGDKNPKAKLTENEVKDIRQRILNMELPGYIFIDYKEKISKSAFYKIWRGETWSHILPEAIELTRSEEHRNFITKQVNTKEYKERMKQVKEW